VGYLRRAIEGDVAQVLPLDSGDCDRVLDPLRSRADFRDLLTDASFPVGGRAVVLVATGRTQPPFNLWKPQGRITMLSPPVLALLPMMLVPTSVKTQPSL
jgi:hypothetical protein